MSRLNFNDPFEIAYLRGGYGASIRVAILSLVDRGLLSVEGTTLTTRSPDASERVRREIEKAILDQCQKGTPIPFLLQVERVQSACDVYQKALEKDNLLAGDEMKQQRFLPFLIGIIAIEGLAVAKLIVALQRGRHNVQFLLMLAAVFAYLFYRVWKRRETALGRRALKDLRHLFSQLLDRAWTISPGGANSDAVLVAAVFGIDNLNPSTFPVIHHFATKRNSAGDASQQEGWSSFSSCGTSCSSCGGGCGGGCGGCGS